MRSLFASIAIVPLVTGCAFLDGIADGQSSSYDPSRIYLGNNERVSVARSSLDRYGCLSGPLLCEQWGRSLECVCP